MFSEAVTHNRIDWVKCPPSGDPVSSAARLRMTAQPMGGFAMSRKIPLTQGKFAIVDDEDYEFLSQQKWHTSKRRGSYYAARATCINGKNRLIHMHRVILNPPPGMESDHINGDGLDNRRCNLRSCTHQDNIRNRRKKAKASSRYKGVWWAKAGRKWRAGIWIKGKTKHLGRFTEEDEAARAYNVAAREHFGEFACLNVIRMH